MNRVNTRHLLMALTCLLASPLASAASQNCAAMEASGPQWFAAQLDKVQATYQGGNSQAAYQQLSEAMSGLPRRVDVSLDARCVGTADWQRMYLLRQAITATLGKQSEAIGKPASTERALDWFVVGGNRDDAQRVIGQLTRTAAGAGFVINRMGSEISTLDQAETSGFELLPQERSARTFWQTRVADTTAYANGRVIAILEQEDGVLNGAVTSEEEQLEAAQEAGQVLVANYLGEDSLAAVNEVQREVNRAGASLTLLVAARDWAQAVSVDAALPVMERAVKRGDALLVRAGDASLGFEARDSLYQTADNYFEFVGDSARQQAVTRGRTAIAPALKAERDARLARTRQKAAELRESAEQAKKAMYKTDEQKQIFKSEADSMEEELGF